MATKTAKAAPKATKTTTKGARTYRPRTAAEKETRRVADKQRRSRAKRAAARAAARTRASELKSAAKLAIQAEAAQFEEVTPGVALSDVPATRATDAVEQIEKDADTGWVTGWARSDGDPTSKSVLGDLHAHLLHAFGRLRSSTIAAKKLADRHLGESPDETDPFERASKLSGVGVVGDLQRTAALLTAAVTAAEVQVQRLAVL
jgi:hypothetical protein